MQRLERDLQAVISGAVERIREVKEVRGHTRKHIGLSGYYILNNLQRVAH